MIASLESNLFKIRGTVAIIKRISAIFNFAVVRIELGERFSGVNATEI